MTSALIMMMNVPVEAQLAPEQPVSGPLDSDITVDVERIHQSLPQL